jgi:hypothetical protein
MKMGRTSTFSEGIKLIRAMNMWSTLEKNLTVIKIC